MKVLLISNQHPNEDGVGNPIMARMCNALAQDKRIEEISFLPVYYSLSSLIKLRTKAPKYDIVHIHFGGLYALIIWFFLIGVDSKKLITFHGTDIHAKALKTAKNPKERLKIWLNQKSSFISIRLFERCGFVAKELMSFVPQRLSTQMQKKAFVQPLGVDYNDFVPMEKNVAQDHLGLEHNDYILFSDVSNTNIKRRDIAEAIVNALDGKYKLLIMSGVKPTAVPYYINACDFALLTSDDEGSPNIIREVLSMNKQFFSVDVGDAAKQLEGLTNSAIISRDANEAAKVIMATMEKAYIDNTRETRKDKLDFLAISRRIVDLYIDIIGR